MKVLEISSSLSVEQLIRGFGTQHLPFVLDSAQSNDGLGAWSFFGAEPFDVIRDVGLSELRDRMSSVRSVAHPEIPFTGGAVGYLSYDYGRRLEAVPELAVDDRRLPDMHFGLYDGIAALHHATGKLYLVAHGWHEPVDAILERLKSWLSVDADLVGGSLTLANWEWNMSEAVFCHAVEQVRSYIASGDVYQVNLSRRARCRYEGDGLDVYIALREGNPAPYGAYLGLGGFELISTSPEQFLQKKGSELVTRPIKGTRPRGCDAEEDRVQEAALRASLKDRAELLMIVDLERNDLGRVAEYGSVQVDGLYQLEHYKRVIHQTAQVKATLAKDKDIYDALEALFPGGSITGAPKVRAMEIIEELEPTRRGAYSGSIGYIGFDGDAEFNIAIRSLHLKDGWLDYQVGGGIVWDSEPESEFQETMDKGRAIRETLDALCQR
ncbi:MAG: aminodeoxychorismate synthase component I [Opitutales bacterium]